MGNGVRLAPAFSAFSGAALLCGTLLASEAAAEERGPAVGREAPEISLESVEGTTFTLSELEGEDPVIVVFFRGAW